MKNWAKVRMDNQSRRGVVPEIPELEAATFSPEHQLGGGVGKAVNGLTGSEEGALGQRRCGRIPRVEHQQPPARVGSVENHARRLKVDSTARDGAAMLLGGECGQRALLGDVPQTGGAIARA